ncbi:MAG: hypothetical protein HMLKMBBP_00047 [Planctomycetes bacterium]|nr:hypothetical protein [Planctomycetota bacterium]
MTELLRLSAENLLSPMVLFFGLGLLAGRLKSDLHVPEAVSKGISLYLMLAIGFKGGAELAAGPGGASVAATLGAAAALSFGLPVAAFAILRGTTRLGRVDAAAVAAHYGSVSVVTFVAATAFLAQLGVPHEGHLVATMAVMETPAIVSGLLLARRGDGRGSAEGALLPRETLREVLLSGSVVLLLGSFAIGWATGAKGLDTMAPVVTTPFKGVLAFFLLDMGVLAARRLGDFRAVGPGLAAFGLVMPLVGASAGLGCAVLLGLSVGGATLLAVLAASASYIVMPAAMRVALPEANPSLYLTVSLGVTFPFNLLAGIPLYLTAARAVVGG